MSKASEWAMLNNGMRLAIDTRNEARVSPDGKNIVLTYYGSDGNISQQIAYSEEQADELARWILSTFGAAPSGESGR